MNSERSKLFMSRCGISQTELVSSAMKRSSTKSGIDSLVVEDVEVNEEFSLFKEKFKRMETDRTKKIFKYMGLRE